MDYLSRLSISTFHRDISKSMEEHDRQFSKRKDSRFTNKLIDLFSHYLLGIYRNYHSINFKTSEMYNYHHIFLGLHMASSEVLDELP